MLFDGLAEQMSVNEKPTKCGISNLFDVSAMSFLFDTDRWEIYIRDHIDAGMIAVHGVPHEVKAEDAYRFSGDFFKYLAYLGFSFHTYWPILLTNGMTHPSQFGPHIKVIYVISGDIMYSWLNKFEEVYHKDADKTKGKMKL